MSAEEPVQQTTSEEDRFNPLDWVIFGLGWLILLPTAVLPRRSAHQRMSQLAEGKTLVVPGSISMVEGLEGANRVRREMPAVPEES